MSIISNFFKKDKPSSANLAKERLQIIVAERRREGQSEPDYLPKLKDELIAVIKKYFEDVDDSDVELNLESDENTSILELNIKTPH
ncbi:cell division topological specificity factor MinE [Vibrio breoganii]